MKGSKTSPRVGWLPAGSANTASSRLRAYLPDRFLRRQGWQSELFDPEAPRYDLVVFQKRYDQASWELSRSLQRQGTRVVFDLCDNHFHYQLDQPEAAAERGRLLDQMIATANVVTTSTSTLAAILENRSERKVSVVDDAVDVPPLAWLWRRWGAWRKSLRARELRLVWFGACGSAQPPFGLIDLGRILPELEALAEEVPLSLTVISNSRSLFDQYTASSRLEPRYHPWSRRDFAYRLSSHDVAVVPVSTNPLTVGKTSNRPVLSLVLGVAVVADSIPSYEELRDFVMLSDWPRGIRQYADRPDQRRRDVRMGRRYIRQRFPPARIAQQWQTVIAEALGTTDASGN